MNQNLNITKEKSEHEKDKLEQMARSSFLRGYGSFYDGMSVRRSKETAAETKTETAASEETKAETAAVETAERGNPQWDVVWIDSMYDVYALSQDGQLKTGWEPENAAGLTEFSKK